MAMNKQRMLLLGIAVLSWDGGIAARSHCLWRVYLTPSWVTHSEQPWREQTGLGGGWWAPLLNFCVSEEVWRYGTWQRAVGYCLRSQPEPPAAPIAPSTPNTDLGRSWWEAQRRALQSRVWHARKGSLRASRQAGESRGLPRAPRLTCFTLKFSPLASGELSAGWLEGWKPPGRLQRDAPIRSTQGHSPNKSEAETFYPAWGGERTNRGLFTAKLHPDRTRLAGSYLNRGEDRSCFLPLFCWLSCAEPQLTQYQLSHLWNTELSFLSKKNPLRRMRGQFGCRAARRQSCRKHPAAATLHQLPWPRLGRCYSLLRAAGSTTSQSMCCNINL